MTLDEQMLDYCGGLHNNSLRNILNIENDNEIERSLIKHSKYYDNDSFINLLKNNDTSLKILSSNIESIFSKYNDIELFIQELSDKMCDLSAICLQECWVSDNDDTGHIQLHGYNRIVKGKSASGKGGLIIYLKDIYEYKIISQPYSSDIWEGLFIEISGGGLSGNYVIGNIYRPPRDLIENYKSFINELKPILSNLESRYTNIILAGDFNINLLRLNDRDVFAEFFDLLTSNGFYPKITLPTRFAPHTATLIDNFFSNLNLNVLDETSGILINKFSDHQPYFTIIHRTCSNIETHKFVKVSKYTNENIKNIHDELENLHILDKLDQSATDPNANYNTLSHIFTSVKNKYIPIKLMKFNKYKHKKSKWITEGILRSIRYRDKLYRSWRLSNNTLENRETIKRNLSTYNGILKKIIRDAKKNYFENCLSNCKNDLKETWRVINDALGRNNSGKLLPDIFKINNTKVDNKLEIANAFNDYFKNIGEKLADNIHYNGSMSFDNYLKKSNETEFSFSQITEKQVETVIDNLSNKQSCGVDGISTNLLKKCKNPLIPALTLIINQTLTSGIFPEKLKVAKVVPLFKNGDKTILSNYRPISLLPAMSKIFEKIVYNQLYQYFDSNNLFYKSQYGFRKNHSTELAALELIDRIKCDLDKGNLPVAIFLDLSKAFDTLDHLILLKKLSFYGIKNKALDLFKNYLKDRKQYVNVYNIESHLQTIKTGVPQGSILGPLLFLIYINDISNAFFEMIKYADDSTIYKSIKMSNFDTSLSNINNELDKIADWLKLNKLSLNVKKSKHMVFHNIWKRVPSFHLKIDGNSIDKITNFSFLGLTINENLTWKNHVNVISNKISRISGLLNRLKFYLPTNTKIRIYNSLILPHCYYGILAWGFECNRIYKLQKASVRSISNSKYNAHTDPLFKQLKLLKVEDIFTIQQYKFYHKYMSNNLPIYFNFSFFTPYTRGHCYNTRTQLDLQIPKIKHEFMKKCIRYSIPCVINKAPVQIKSKLSTHSLKGFAWYLKTIYIEAYQLSCNVPNCYICNI